MWRRSQLPARLQAPALQHRRQWQTAVGDAALKASTVASSAEVDVLSARAKCLLHLATRLHGDDLLRCAWLDVCHLTEPQTVMRSRTLVDITRMLARGVVAAM